ncbi:hypothetical protein BKA03_002728 [Demequina lutea]|uniref:Uncharacterized protein n=1 Tax=Demequina lutea TaxID=431489 RepID=A0A7Y9ZC16_9MICO|nr:hypothetical protein [Demequina lutea]
MRISAGIEALSALSPSRRAELIPTPNDGAFARPTSGARVPGRPTGRAPGDDALGHAARRHGFIRGSATAPTPP